MDQTNPPGGASANPAPILHESTKKLNPVTTYRFWRRTF